MAIGDTVQAGLMRVDSSPIQIAGAAQAKANQAFGNALGQAAEGYFIGKEKKERAKEIEEELIRQGASPESAKAISKNPFLQKEHARKQEANQRMAIEKMRAASAAAISGAKNAQVAALEETRIKEKGEADAKLEEKELADNQFIGKIMGSSSVPTGQLNESGQDEFERGSLFIAPTKEAVSDFKDTLLRDPSTQTKVPMMDLEGNQFIRQFSEDSPEVQRRALNFMQARQKDAPKPMTPMEEAELKKINLANRKAEIEVSDLETPKTDYKAGPTIVEDNIFRALDIIKESPRTTTGMGSYLSNIPGTDAKSLKERLGSIKANIGFDYLQAMREASPTGGALGNVSDKELQGLQSVFGSLEQSLDDAELTYNLNLLNYTYNNVIHGEGNHNVLDPRKNGNSPQQSANTIDPADLDNAIQAKKKLLEQRTMMQQTLDNPNVPNYGSQ